MKVYRYGLLRPLENAPLVASQMRAAHRYRNILVEIERGRRFALRTLMSSFTSISELEVTCRDREAGVVAAVRAAASANSETRRLPSPELRAAIVTARMSKRTALDELREARARLKPEIERQKDDIEERAKWLRKNAREHCGVYWGTYQLIEDADMASRKTPLYDGAESNDPRFLRWSGEGQVSVQLQGGLGLDELETDTQVRIEPADVPTGADPTSKRSARRRYCMLAMRVSSTGKARVPVWAKWPMVMHRPLPEGAVIKRATVALRKIGPRDEWSVTITVDRSASAGSSNPRRAAPERSVGIDVGWRQLDGATRVAAWHGSDGAFGELVLPEQLLSQVRKADDLRAIRDRAFNIARDALVVALDRTTGDDPETAPWLTEATSTLSQWRSPARLAALAVRWRDKGFSPEQAEAYAALEAWRYHDHHLWEWETSQRTKALRHRREVFRIFAAGLAKRYEKLVLEEFDLRPMARHESPESGVAENTSARSMRQLAAPSELRLVLVNAFGGAEKVPAHDTTRTCNACESVQQWDQAAEISHTCSACGVRWDQDANAALNILRRASTGGGGEVSGVARNDVSTPLSGPIVESRWTRAKRMKTEKDARKGPAREVGDEAAE